MSEMRFEGLKAKIEEMRKLLEQRIAEAKMEEEKRMMEEAQNEKELHK